MVFLLVLDPQLHTPYISYSVKVSNSLTTGKKKDPIADKVLITQRINGKRNIYQLVLQVFSRYQPRFVLPAIAGKTEVAGRQQHVHRAAKAPVCQQVTVTC